MSYPKAVGAIDVGALMDVIEAAERAERKLRIEYHGHHPDAPANESWAEGERLRDELDALRDKMRETVGGVSEQALTKMSFYWDALDEDLP